MHKWDHLLHIEQLMYLDPEICELVMKADILEYLN